MFLTVVKLNSTDNSVITTVLTKFLLTTTVLQKLTITNSFAENPTNLICTPEIDNSVEVMENFDKVAA